MRAKHTASLAAACLAHLGRALLSACCSSAPAGAVLAETFVAPLHCRAVPEVSEDANVSVQHVPLPNAAPNAGSSSSNSEAGNSGDQHNGPAVPALLMVQAPAPVWLGAGNMASWSWQ
jgi:hypothetical protein